MSTGRALMLVALAVALNAAVTGGLLSMTGGAGKNVENLRKVGSRLQGAGLRSEAARYYETYLQQSTLEPAAKANIALTAGGLLMDEGEHERALGLLYQVELLAPGSEAAKEAGRQIVTALERSGHGAAARSAMASRVNVSKKKGDVEPDADDPVVARAGTVEVKRSDYLTILEGLPAQLRQQAGSEGRQDELLQQALVMQALYQKAVARGLDGDANLKRRVEAVRRDLITAALVESVAAERIRPSPQDLRNFYEANKATFGDQTFEEAQQEVQNRYLSSRMAELYPELAKDAIGSARIETFPQHLPPAAPSPQNKKGDEP